MQILDPSSEHRASRLHLAPRLTSLEGVRIGLLSNGKAGVDRLFDELESRIAARWRARDCTRLRKSNYSAPAPSELIDSLSRCDAVITGVGD
jgi:hypothetical protein